MGQAGYFEWPLAHDTRCDRSRAGLDIGLRALADQTVLSASGPPVQPQSFSTMKSQPTIGLAPAGDQ